MDPKERRANGYWAGLAAYLASHIGAFAGIVVAVIAGAFVAESAQFEALQTIVSAIGSAVGAGAAFHTYSYLLRRKEKKLVSAAHIRKITLALRATRTIRETAITVTYLRHARASSRPAKLLVASCGVAYAIWALSAPAALLIGPLTLCTLLLATLVARDWLIEWRIEKGLFGTNKGEARALVDFVLKSADEIDFTDGQGGSKKTFLPEKTTESTGVSAVTGRAFR